VALEQETNTQPGAYAPIRVLHYFVSVSSGRKYDTIRIDTEQATGCVHPTYVRQISNGNRVVPSFPDTVYNIPAQVTAKHRAKFG